MSRRSLQAAFLLATVALAGCAGFPRRSPVVAKPTAKPAPAAPAPAPQAAAQPTVRIVKVYVPKPNKCVPEDLGPAPAYPDSDTALRDAGGAADRYQLLAAGRILRQERLAKLEDIVRRCRNASR